MSDIIVRLQATADDLYKVDGFKGYARMLDEAWKEIEQLRAQVRESQTPPPSRTYHPKRTPP